MYIPNSRIITNLYSNDRKLVYKATKEFYIGFYYKTYDGRYYTGKTQNDPPNVELEIVEDTDTSFTPNLPQNEIAYGDFPSIFPDINTPGYDEGMVVDYAKLQKINLNVSTRKSVPYQCYPSPIEDDYKVGSYTRFFSKKINEQFYLELDEDLYDKLDSKDGDWMWEPYLIFKIQWVLTGIEEEVEKTNSSMIQIAERRNKIIGLGRFLKFDFSKYYK